MYYNMVLLATSSALRGTSDHIQTYTNAYWVKCLYARAKKCEKEAISFLSKT